MAWAARWHRRRGPDHRPAALARPRRARFGGRRRCPWSARAAPDRILLDPGHPCLLAVRRARRSTRKWRVRGPIVLLRANAHRQRTAAAVRAGFGVRARADLVADRRPSRRLL